ncbi:MAG: helix-turn-helix domain-containing protein [Armatimonadota bacterium]
MQVGQEIVPFNMFIGSNVPNGLMIYKGINASAKLVYARLVRYGGKDGVAFPSQSTLADECGISRRCCQLAIEQLEKQRFIFKKGIRNKCTVYGFLLHPCLIETAQKVRTSEAQNEPKPAQYVRTTEEDESKCAENALLPAQNLQSTCAENAHKGTHEGSHGRDISSTVRTPVVDRVGTWRNQGDVDDEPLPDPRESKLPLLVQYSRFTGRDPTPAEFETSRQIMASPDWDVDIALGTMEVVAGLAQKAGTRINSFNFFVKSIVEALVRGEVPSGTAKGGNQGGRKRNAFGCGI